MKLKKIRMIGFKSFADETIVETQDGITAIVGPNGCGKSNILDAVRWVLGEKSARGLRAKNMDDVIFLGSEYRKSAGMAEVELIFDNTDNSLPIEFAEVQIGRRIYLNSGSEYLLNGKKTTRREVERIFMDTGIGKSAYSIMEQGGMSEILRAAPEDRRAIFDEAAGISRFKSDREETMTRLKDTDQNLLRLNDILKSKEDELKHLERQAKKTREYLSLKERLDERDRTMRYLKFKELEERREKVQEKLKQLTEKRDAVFQKITESEQSAEEMENKNNSEVEEMHRLDRDYHQALAGMESIQENIERLDGEKKKLNEKVKALNERKKNEDKKCAEIKSRMEKAQQLELNLNEEIKSFEETSARLDEEIKRLRKEIEESHAQEDAIKKELENLEQAQASLLEELKAIAHELIQELESHKRGLQETESMRTALKDEIIGHLDQDGNTLNSIRSSLKNKNLEETEKFLSALNHENIRNAFIKYENIENEFRTFFFGKSGLLSKKESLDKRIDENILRKEELQKNIVLLLKNRNVLQESIEKESGRKVEVDLKIRDAQTRKTSSIEVRKSIVDQLKEAEERVEYYTGELNAISDQENTLKEDITRNQNELRAIQKKNSSQFKVIEGIRKKIEKDREALKKIRESSKKDRDYLENTLPHITDQERKSEGIDVAITTLEENLYNDFQMSISELRDYCKKSKIDLENVENDFRRIKTEIQSLGQFNPLAIEELERAKDAYNHIVDQKKDVESARGDIMNILKEIDDISRVRFMETFQSIQNNFTQVFQTLFGGGNAHLTLTDPEDPLKSGVDIMVQPPGKKNTMISLLSGGEQNMTAIALMFATYLVRPSPFCFLDEIDAPLDDNNVSRFLKMLSGFSNRSQFLVITHNKQTMMKASGIFGVTQEEPGISKLVSVQLKGNDAALQI